MTSRLTILALAAAALALPAVASASSVTYIDGGNVRVASPDGSINRAVSTDGTTQSPYHLPTAADDGEITAIQGGNTNSKVLTVFPPGASKVVNVLPWQVTSYTNIGPNGASVNPTGGQIAYTYYKNHGPYSGYPMGGFENRLAVVWRKAPGHPAFPAIDQGKNWEEPTWIDNKLVVSVNGELHYEKAPLEFEHFLSFDPNPQGQRLLMERGLISRDKSRYLVFVRDWNQVTGLYLIEHTGPFPGGTTGRACWLPVDTGLDMHFGLSPDGTQVTWADKNGVHVGTYSPANQAGTVCQGPRTTLSATGSEPSFGMATLTNPTPPADPKPQPQPQPQTPAPPVTPPAVTKPVLKSATTTPRIAPGNVPAATTTGSPVLELAAPATVKAAASLASGLKVAASAPKAGTLSAKLRDKGRTLGSAKLTVKKAGRYTLKLKLTKAGKKAVKRLKGKKVTLTVSFAPRGGGAKLSSTAKVALK